MSSVVTEECEAGKAINTNTKTTFTEIGTGQTATNAKTERGSENAQPKVLIVRDDLAVGYAGDDPDFALEVIVGLRKEPIDAALNTLEDVDGLSFLVGSLKPEPRLWHVARGKSEERTQYRRGWIGDGDMSAFLESYHQWPDETDVSFKLLSSMQDHISFGRTPSVGGFHTRVGTVENGFRYAGDTTMIGFGDLSQICVPGQEPTAGALAYWIPQWRLARLFTQNEPWNPHNLEVGSIPELVSRARDEYGQILEAPPLPDWPLVPSS